MSDEDVMHFVDFMAQLEASNLSEKGNPEIVVELSDGSCLEISEVTWDRGEKVILIQTTDN